MRYFFLALLCMTVAGCGYHPPSINSREDVARISQSHTSLRVRGLSDADIPSLESRTNLVMLFFSDGHAVMEAKITDEGLAHLGRLKLEKLRVLDLGYCDGITDEGLRYLWGLDSVRDLNLRANVNLSDAGLRNLAGMKKVRRLDLRGCDGITDEGLLHLVKMRGLRRVELGGCAQISPVGVRRLQARLPSALVVKDDREWSFHE